MAQMAIIKTARRTSRRTRNSSRNTVPAFVQKTYNIVSDSNNYDVIRWSDSGESFLILDQQRLAREVLGQWFKHENPNSFVRQLNNYGFYKIQDLQQGALRNGTEAEYCCFAHIHNYFRRGEPNLLSRIRPGPQTNRTRNRNLIPTQTQDSGDDDTLTDFIDGDDCCAAPHIQGGQIPDMSAILRDVAAMKRAQANQTAELDKLRQAYQVLFQDCHTRLQQHQETINRILGLLNHVYETYQSKNTGDARESSSCADAIILRSTVHQAAPHPQGQPGNKSPGNFKIVEVEASEVKNKTSMYSIETPTEDVASPTSTLDDGSLDNTAITHGPRFSDDLFYHPHSFNPNITLDSSACDTTFYRNLRNTQYGEEQAEMLASALDPPTPQTPTPLNASRPTAINITQYNFEAEEQPKAKDGLDELPPTTVSSPMRSFVMPTTPLRANPTPYPTSSPTFNDSSSLSTDAQPSSPDTPFDNSSSFSSPDFVFDPLPYLTVPGNQGNDWMSGIDVSIIDDANGLGIDTGGTGIGDTRYACDIVGATSFPSANAGISRSVVPSFMGGSPTPAQAMITIDATTVPMNVNTNANPGVDPSITVNTAGRKRKPREMMDSEGTRIGVVTAGSAESKKRRVSD